MTAMDAEHLLPPEVERTFDALVARHPAFGAHERFVRERLAELALRGYRHGVAAARLDLHTTQQAADELGISARRVRALARARGLGWDTGHDLVLTGADIDAMRDRRPGRPRRAEDDA